MGRKRINKLDMEQMIVGYNDLPMADGTANGTVVPSVAGSLVNTTTSLGIADGQLGLLSVDFDSTVRPNGIFLQAGDTINDVRKVKLLQGTPKSAQTQLVSGWEESDLAYMQSGIIRAGKIRSVTTKTCELGTYSSTYFTAFAAPLDLADYKMYVNIESVRNDRQYGDNDEIAFANFVTPEYSDPAIATAIPEPLDHLLQNMLYELNLYSKIASFSNGAVTYGNKNMVAFGLNSGGGAGVAIGGITAGTIIPVVNSNGLVLNYVATLEFVNTVNTWIARGVLPTATIEVIDLTTAGTNPTIDSFIVMGLDEDVSVAFDDVKFVRTRVNVSLGDSFNFLPLPTKVIGAEAKENTGTGRDWTIENDNRARLTIHNMQNQPFGDYFVQGVTYIDPSKSYTSTIIDYYDEEETITDVPQSPKQVILLLECQVVDPAATATAGLTYATVDTATVASLNAILGAWLTSERTLSNHAIKGDATPGVYFV